MRVTRIDPAFIVLAVILSPAVAIASASGSTEIGPVVVQIDNGHEADCLEEASGLCIGSANVGGPGTTELDLRQEIRYIGVGFNETFRASANDMVGYPLLPSGDIIHGDASALRLHHGVFPLLVEHIGTKQGPAGVFFIAFSEESWSWGYLGPGLSPLDTTIASRQQTSGYYDGGTGYEETGGFEEIVIESDTDEVIRSWALASCYELHDATCVGQENQVDVLESTTPNVAFSLLLYETQVAGSSDTLGRRQQDIVRGSAGEASLLRGSALQPNNRPQPEMELRAPIEWRRPPSNDSGPSGQKDPVHVQLSSNVTMQSPEPEEIARWSAAGAYAASFAIALAMASLYARISRRDDALRSQRRTLILSILREKGPRTIAELAHDVQLDWSTVEHHARLLKKTGHVNITRDRSRAVVALPGQNGHLAESKPTAWHQILCALNESGGTLLRHELHARLAWIPLRTRNHALNQLAMRGLLIEEDTPFGLRLRVAS